MSTFATLSNGVRVCNMSSFHPFTFDDGTVLPGCDADFCNRMSLIKNEEFVPALDSRWEDVRVSFQLSAEVEECLERLHERDDVDIIIVPFPVMQSIKAADMDVCFPKCRVICIRKDKRAEKIAHHDRFCV